MDGDWQEKQKKVRKFLGKGCVIDLINFKFLQHYLLHLKKKMQIFISRKLLFSRGHLHLTCQDKLISENFSSVPLLKVSKLFEFIGSPNVCYAVNFSSVAWEFSRENLSRKDICCQRDGLLLWGETFCFSTVLANFAESILI